MLANVRQLVGHLDRPRLHISTSHAISTGNRRHIRAAAASEGTNGSQLQPLPMSLFHPFKSLPPDGQIIPPSEENCDVLVSNCKEPTYTYETKCGCCSGTGYARASSRGRSGRGSLHKCVVCIGMGFVRRTTARYMPDSNVEEHMTLARKQRLPGEPEQQTMPSGPSGPGRGRASRLRQAAERAGVKFDQPAAASASAPASSTPPEPAPMTKPQDAPGPAAQFPAPANNVVSSNGLGAQAAKQVGVSAR